MAVVDDRDAVLLLRGRCRVVSRVLYGSVAGGRVAGI
ncbi:MAG: hypothetical protein QOH20_84, partial [Mycobacterium sp.]|nr:hypothetical protein [Mycobacterium sp.]